MNQGQHMSANSEAMRIEAQLVQQQQERSLMHIKVTATNPLASAPIAREMVNIPHVVPLDLPPSYKFELN